MELLKLNILNYLLNFVKNRKITSISDLEILCKNKMGTEPKSKNVIKGESIYSNIFLF